MVEMRYLQTVFETIYLHLHQQLPDLIIVIANYPYDGSNILDGTK
jgi:hypothetical protein